MGKNKYVYTETGRYEDEKNQEFKIDFVFPRTDYPVRLFVLGKTICDTGVYITTYDHANKERANINYETDEKVLLDFDGSHHCEDQKQKVKQSPLYKRNISREEIIETLGEDIDKNSPEEYEQILKLTDFLINTLKYKDWAFLYKHLAEENYPYHYGESLLLNVLKNRNILSVEKFNNEFRIIHSEKDKPYYIRNLDILIANFNPWEGVPEYYNVYSFDYTSFEIPTFDNEEVVVKLVNVIEYLLTSSLQACHNCLNEKQVSEIKKFIENRRTKQGIEFVLENKLKERFNFMAAFELLGAYDRYHYSIEDLQKRSFLADRNWLGVITQNEKEGKATPIHIKDGYDQYVAQYGTDSAFFLGLKYIQMGSIFLNPNVVSNKTLIGRSKIIKDFKAKTTKILKTSQYVEKNDLIDANEYIKKGKYVEGVKKLDLMGGKTSQLGDDFVNIDIIAEKSIKGSVTDLDKFIKPNSIDEIVCSSPQADFLEQVSKVLKQKGKIYINATVRNNFFKNIKQGNVEKYGFEVLEYQTNLEPKFQNLTFYFTDGIRVIPNSSMYTTILIKK